MKAFYISIIFILVYGFSFSQKSFESNESYIGKWSYDDYKSTFIYNPQPILFSFSDEMVEIHFQNVWGFNIFKKFPSYPKFQAIQKDNPTQEDVVLYLNDLYQWYIKHPEFRTFIESKKSDN
ncbi:MAG: hypothetical protein KDE33_04320 [Bacteroidetes bacterium]|nr:hypothetical protein [Bacteroidota bacterium]MCB9227207.1 hypothetical protein [Chitinophagales bacterium]